MSEPLVRWPWRSVGSVVLAVNVSTGTVVTTPIGDAYTAPLPAAGPDRSHVYRRGQRQFTALAMVSALCVAFATNLGAQGGAEALLLAQSTMASASAFTTPAAGTPGSGA